MEVERVEVEGGEETWSHSFFLLSPFSSFLSSSQLLLSLSPPPPLSPGAPVSLVGSCNPGRTRVLVAQQPLLQLSV